MSDQRQYRFGDSVFTLCFGDITKSRAQAIVSSDDHYLSMGGGVSGAILRAGGNAIALDAAKKVPAALGDVIVTNAGTLQAQYVFHAVTIGEKHGTAEHRAIIRKATGRCMHLLDALNLNSVAFPAIGAGAARFPYEDVAVEMAGIIAADLLERNELRAAETA